MKIFLTVIYIILLLNALKDIIWGSITTKELQRKTTEFYFKGRKKEKEIAVEEITKLHHLIKDLKKEMLNIDVQMPKNNVMLLRTDEPNKDEVVAENGYWNRLPSDGEKLKVVYRKSK